MFSRQIPPYQNGMRRVPLGMARPPSNRFFPPQMHGNQPPGRGRGLLSRLLKKQSNPMNHFTGFERQIPTGGASLLKNASNVGTLNRFLTNTQQVLNTVQQVGPMIQQYGPMVKNLPVLWKLYRGLSSESTDEKNDSEEQMKEQMKEQNDEISEVNEDVKLDEPVETKQFTQEPPQILIEESSTKKTSGNEKHPVKKKNSGKSIPKLYI
ncbi:hypothetical protein J2S13_000293 [Oikeobacillus pervagus]|uniref:YqfQ-like protein n=1 Tax=Oikeobacillus pervagus TaxID=1325931 RepID=A0AAJ1SWH6_9BACI|nr:VrrA/YqfQ family protein [Oikeobacillus pervagus]MDQ0213899.1 hypothetical protein [Oikeobacillus pervagus]